MKHPLSFIPLLLALLLSCKSPDPGTQENLASESLETEAPKTDLGMASTFDYQRFPIQKGRLGPIRIGMTIAEAEAEFDGLRKEVSEAILFGYGGGSPAYLYYDRDKVAFGLIPILGTDTVLLIIAADPQLTTTNGLHPTSTVREITAQYPGIQVNLDMLNDWEYFADTANRWEFVFMTGEGDAVGEFGEGEDSAPPLRMDIRADWITID